MAKKQNAAYNAVKNYLDKRAEEDELFAKAYAKEGKSIDGCMAYIIERARKMGGSCVMATDEEVYGWAVHYYDEDNVHPVKITTADVTVGMLPESEPKKAKKPKKAEAKEGERGFVANLFGEML